MAIKWHELKAVGAAECFFFTHRKEMTCDEMTDTACSTTLEDWVRRHELGDPRLSMTETACPTLQSCRRYLFRLDNPN